MLISSGLRSQRTLSPNCCSLSHHAWIRNVWSTSLSTSVVDITCHYSLSEGLLTGVQILGYTQQHCCPCKSASAVVNSATMTSRFLAIAEKDSLSAGRQLQQSFMSDALRSRRHNVSALA